MDGVEFYQKHVQFNENISRIQMERAKLEQEFFTMSRSNKTSKSLRLAHLRNYYKQACEREKRSITRNRALMKEFKGVETKLKSLESQTQKLQNMRKTYEQEITRLYPQWRQKVEIAKAQRQLEELGFHHGSAQARNRERTGSPSQQEDIVKPVLGNTVNVAGFSNASITSSHGDSLPSATPDVIQSPKSLTDGVEQVADVQSSKSAMDSTPASVGECVSRASSGLVHIPHESATPVNDVVQPHSGITSVPSSNISVNESPPVSEHHTISSRQETGLSSVNKVDKDDVISSVSSHSNKIDTTAPSSRSASVPLVTSVDPSLPPQPQRVTSRQGSIARTQSSVSNASVSEKSEVSKTESAAVSVQSGSADHPSESSISVQQKVSTTSDKDSAKQSTKDPVSNVGKPLQRYDDAPYSYADDESFNISDEASDSFDSELSDPASRKVIQVKESSHSALNSISEAAVSGPNSRGSPSKSGPIVIPGVDNLNDTGDSNLTDSITSNMTSPRAGPLTSSAAYKALVSPTDQLGADDFSDEEDELEDVLSPTSKSHFDEFGKSTASSDSIAEKSGKNQTKTSTKTSDNKPVSAVSLDSKTSQQKKKAYKAPWETDSDDDDDDYSFQESSAKNNPALNDDDDDDDFDFYD